MMDHEEQDQRTGPMAQKHGRGWTDTLRAAGLSAQTIKSRRYKMVHLAALLMPSGPEDVTTEQIVQVVRAAAMETGDAQGVPEHHIVVFPMAA
ncbi:MAG: hypothetical protein V9G11_01035 [Bifidobacterium adolescentis]